MWGYGRVIGWGDGYVLVWPDGADAPVRVLGEFVDPETPEDERLHAQGRLDELFNVEEQGEHT